MAESWHGDSSLAAGVDYGASGFVNSASGAAGSPVVPTAGLVPVADERDGKVRLHLPSGFNYRSFHDTEPPVTLRDGTALPGRHDGMGKALFVNIQSSRGMTFAIWGPWQQIGVRRCAGRHPNCDQ